MIFRQFYDPITSSLSYLLANADTLDAVIIDPLLGSVNEYLAFLKSNELQLSKVIDTHLHSDHITGMARLRNMTNCITVMGQEGQAEIVSIRVNDNDTVNVGAITLTAIKTPGHTKDSYCFSFDGMLFSGDTLLIGRPPLIEQETGSIEQLYNSIHEKILTLPPETIIYPGHSFNGENVSTLKKECESAEYLKAKGLEKFTKFIKSNAVKDENNDLRYLTIPANINIGNDVLQFIAAKSKVLPKDFSFFINRENVLLVDLRETKEIEQNPLINSAIHIEYSQLEKCLTDGESQLSKAIENQNIIIFYCSYGERSTLAVKTMIKHEHKNCIHLQGGIVAWNEFKDDSAA
jgi:sulfur dioxygenase